MFIATDWQVNRLVGIVIFLLQPNDADQIKNINEDEDESDLTFEERKKSNIKKTKYQYI